MRDKGISPAALGAALRGDIENFFVASTPGGIELQESAGQAAFVGTKGILPTRCPRADLEKLGFVFGAPADELFTEVTFPAGWSKKGSDHAMWSYLLDEKGRERGAIFYKAAFYDRRADMHGLNRRYVRSGEYLNKDLTKAQGSPAMYRSVVKDNGTGEVLFATEATAYGAFALHEELDKQSDAWLAEKFPNNKDHFAYWD